ncbi:MAG: hypothetical protein QG640_6 [Patescibacteria group bacterium]|nr:hypothetical protein [Patescibacteria group bacterium]
MRRRFVELRNKFSPLYDRVTAIHKGLIENQIGNSGHGLDHDLMVAQYCLLIAENDDEAEMAWCAALLHSFDRFFSEEAEQLVHDTFRSVEDMFGSVETALILVAISEHNKPNDPKDSMVTIILKDADRLANCVATIITRSGQFNSTIPAVELGYTNGKGRHPDSTYGSPRSCRDDVLSCLEWEASEKFGIRLRKARELAKPKFDFLRQYFTQIEKSFQEVGLDRWPITVLQ